MANCLQKLVFGQKACVPDRIRKDLKRRGQPLQNPDDDGMIFYRACWLFIRGFLPHLPDPPTPSLSRPVDEAWRGRLSGSM